MTLHLSDGVSDTSPISDTLSSVLEDAEDGTASGLLVEDFSDS
jgi:hypothetical protein